MLEQRLNFLLRISKKQIIIFLLLSFALIGISAFTILNFFLPLVLIAWLWAILGWKYITGITLFRIIPEKTSLSLKFFRYNLAFAAIYPVIMVILGIAGIMANAHPAIYVMHAYLAFSIFYAIYFISKSLVAIEEKRNVDYFDYRVTFYKFCSFFPFTAIPIQNRVQSLILKEDELEKN